MDQPLRFGTNIEAFQDDAVLGNIHPGECWSPRAAEGDGRESRWEFQQPGLENNTPCNIAAVEFNQYCTLCTLNYEFNHFHTWMHKMRGLGGDFSPPSFTSIPFGSHNQYYLDFDTLNS